MAANAKNALKDLECNLHETSGLDVGKYAQLVDYLDWYEANAGSVSARLSKVQSGDDIIDMYGKLDSYRTGVAGYANSEDQEVAKKAFEDGKAVKGLYEEGCILANAAIIQMTYSDQTLKRIAAAKMQEAEKAKAEGAGTLKTANDLIASRDKAIKYLNDRNPPAEKKA
jgi:hypothetical protein